MRSSSTDAGRRASFWPTGSGAWVRLVAVVALGAAALTAPVLDRTGAVYRDSEVSGFDVVGPAPSPTAATGTPTPTLGPTATATAEPTPTATATEAPATPAQQRVVPGADRRSIKP